MIVVVASEKGGTGKTTIATNLAVFRAKNASDVLLIDADPQESSMDFVTVRSSENHSPALTCAAIKGVGTGEELRKLHPKFDDIIVDVGGRDSSTLRSALLYADVLVIPFLPSQYDTWGIERMDQIVSEIMAPDNPLRTIAFLNKVDTNPKINLSGDASTFAEQFKSLKFFKHITVGNRIAFRRSVADGLGVSEEKRRDKKAIDEIQQLYNEVFKNA